MSIVAFGVHAAEIGHHLPDRLRAFSSSLRHALVDGFITLLIRKPRVSAASFFIPESREVVKALEAVNRITDHVDVSGREVLVQLAKQAIRVDSHKR